MNCGGENGLKIPVAYRFNGPEKTCEMAHKENRCLPFGVSANWRRENCSKAGRGLGCNAHHHYPISHTLSGGSVSRLQIYKIFVYDNKYGRNKKQNNVFILVMWGVLFVNISSYFLSLHYYMYQAYDT